MRKNTERTPMRERYSLEVPIACLSLSPFTAIVLYQPDEYDAGKCEFVVADLDVFCEPISPRRVKTHIDCDGKLIFTVTIENVTLTSSLEYRNRKGQK